MNKLTVKVKRIEDHGIVTYITLDAGGMEIKTIKSNMPEWLEEGDQVNMVFQELSVCVGKSCEGKLSIRNKIAARLKRLRTRGTLSELLFESAIGEICSLMTQRSFDELELAVGDEAVLLLREIDIDLQPCIVPRYDFPTELDQATRTKVAN
jgi:molybdopterin-binding protein